MMQFLHCMKARYMRNRIGRRGGVEWPAKSPDLSPWTSFLWGYLENIQYAMKPANIEDVKQSMKEEADHLDHQMHLLFGNHHNKGVHRSRRWTFWDFSLNLISCQDLLNYI